MPSSIWTPAAVASERFRARRRLWRAVEAQHVAATMRLVANAEEQGVLERLLESSKPPLPEGAARLHYLLGTPFRYRAPLGSRFRAAVDSGVWYGAEAIRTACAELGFWRWRFLTDSAGLDSLAPAPQTVFCAGVDAQMIDLTRAPFKRDRSRWTDPGDYAATQHFAQTARAGHAQAIRYESVRDPEHGAAVAVLTPEAFSPASPFEQQTWFLTVQRCWVTWQREREVYEFRFEG